MKPDVEATPLAIPISVPAYGGAMSMWLTKKPHRATPYIVDDSVINATASALLLLRRKLTPTNDDAAPNKPEYSKREQTQRLSDTDT